MDVLDLHRGVIHQDAYGQGHSAQRHGVKRVARRPQDDNGRQDRQRDRGGDDQGAAPRAEEHQDHQRRQARGDGAFFEHAHDGRTHEDRLVEQELHLELGRHLGLDARHRLADALDDAQRGGALPFEDGHEHRPAAVAADDVRLHRVAVTHVGHVFDVNRYAVDGLDRNLIEGVDDAGAAVELDVVLGRPHLGGAGRDDEVLIGDGRADVVGRQAAGVQGIQVEVDHDLPLLAAPGLGHARPLHRAQLLNDEVLAVVENLLLGQRVAGDADLHNRHAGSAVADNEGRRDAGRHDLQ